MKILEKGPIMGVVLENLGEKTENVRKNKKNMK
jgi:hypothetical protein